MNLSPALAERPLAAGTSAAPTAPATSPAAESPSGVDELRGSTRRKSASDRSLLPSASAEALTALPELWRAYQLSSTTRATTPTGFTALDAELPGGGWPHRTLTELLLPHLGLGELRLLVPALARIAGSPANDAVLESGRGVMLFDPPAALCGWALAKLGVDAQQLLVVYGRDGASAPLRRLLPSADLLWALEQALKSGHVGAVLAWLPPRLRADALRRLQLGAQAHDGPVFLFRDVEARVKPSAAPLRLLLQGAGIDRLSVRVLKRRGPPLLQPVVLALPPVLSERLRARGEAAVLHPPAASVAADAHRSVAAAT